MAPNINPETGIAYGYIAARSLDPELVEELLNTHGENLSEAEALEAEKNRWIELEGHLHNFNEDKFCDNMQIEEPTIKGECDGVKYMSSWLGGALNFFIFSSPTTGSYWACNPCVPGAGNLDQPGGSVVCYDVPRDWMRHDN